MKKVAKLQLITFYCGMLPLDNTIYSGMEQLKDFLIAFLVVLTFNHLAVISVQLAKYA